MSGLFNKKTAIAFFILVLAGIAVVIPFFFSGLHKPMGLLNTHDLGTIYAIMQEFDKGLRSGAIYPRWLADINYGYGVATMVYYPPGVFYLASVFHVIVNDWLTTVFVIAALSMALSGICLYVLSRRFYGRPASVVAALVYMLFPYHLLDLYWRGALPEFLGFVFLPVITYFALMVGSEARLRHYAGLGLFYGLYLMIHLPVGYLFTYALAFYAVAWALRQRDLRIALRIAGGMGIGLVLSAVYWLPAALEGKHAHEFVTDIFPYHKSYITLQPGNNVFDDLVNDTFAYQVLVLLVALVILRATARAEVSSPDSVPGRESDKPLWPGKSLPRNGRALLSAESATRMWTIMALAATFMCTSFSIYISKLIPKIQIAVPAWRWLAIAGFFSSLAVGAAVERLFSGIEMSALKLWACRAAIGGAIALNIWLTFGSVIGLALSNGAYLEPPDFVTGGFIPKGATDPGGLPNTARALVEPNGGVAEVTIWEPQHRELIVRVDQPSELRLKTYNFPGWTARIDGQIVPLSSDKDGVQLVSIPTGRYRIRTDFVDTPPRKIGGGLFIIGFILIVGLAAADFLKRRTVDRKADLERGPPGKGQTFSSLASLNPRILLTGLLAVVVVVVGIVLVRWRNADSRSSSVGRSTNPTRAPDTAALGTLVPNSEARLYVNGFSSIPIAIDENALDELMNALPMATSNRVEELIQAGKVYRVANNTKVRILEVGFAKIKVRVLEGESAALDGWVPERWIR